jgi:hypothetical protein
MTATSPLPAREPATGSEWDLSFDVVIAGSGAAGLSAALTASISGLVPLLVEGSHRWGGTTAMSAGGVWVPGNSLARNAGVEDSEEQALAYLESVVGDVGPASSDARRRAYLQAAPEMADAFGNWISAVEWHALPGLPLRRSWRGLGGCSTLRRSTSAVSARGSRRCATGNRCPPSRSCATRWLRYCTSPGPGERHDRAGSRHDGQGAALRERASRLHWRAASRHY